MHRELRGEQRVVRLLDWVFPASSLDSPSVSLHLVYLGATPIPGSSRPLAGSGTCSTWECEDQSDDAGPDHA